MSVTFKLRRAASSGNVPSSMTSGEICIDEYTGKLFWRQGPSGTVTPFPILAPANTFLANNTNAASSPSYINASAALSLLGAAPLSSPALTGTPTAPTAAAGTSTTQIATTAFVAASGITGPTGPSGAHGATGVSGPTGATGASASVPASSCDVASPSSFNQSISNSFTTIQLSTVKRDDGSNFNTSTYIYTCPVAGWYSISGSLRVADGTAAGKQFGIGIYTSNIDGPWFLWHIVGPTPATRCTYPYARLSYQAAGDQLRMYSYSDSGVSVIAAGLQVSLHLAGAYSPGATGPTGPTGPANGPTGATGPAGSAGATGAAGTVQLAGSGGALAGDSTLIYDTTNKALTVGGGTLTGSTSYAPLTVSQTWNNANTTFYGLRVLINNSNSANPSYPFAVFAGSANTNIFAVSATGNATVYANFAAGGSIQAQQCQGLQNIAIGSTIIDAPVTGRTRFNTTTAGTLGAIATGGVFIGYAAKTAAYTLTQNDSTIDVQTGGLTMTLPTAVGITGQVYLIKQTASSGSTTIATTSGQTIDGATTATLAAQYSAMRVQSTGTNWIVLSKV